MTSWTPIATYIKSELGIANIGSHCMLLCNVNILKCKIEVVYLKFKHLFLTYVLSITIVSHI